MTFPGRNDPCTCGSGRKFKYCCGRVIPREADPDEPWVRDVREALADRDFSSLDELNEALQGVMANRNRTPSDDFHGLTPEQMHRVLHFPFESPDVVVFADTLESAQGSPAALLLGAMVEAIGENGLKATATGNLPRQFCRDARDLLDEHSSFGENRLQGSINSELDFHPLHTVRVVVELAGLIRRYRGRFILSRDCRAMLARGGIEAAYHAFFRAYVRKFNWGYWDLMPDVHFLQSSFLFSLFLLDRYGDEWLPGVFYEDQFLRAFPGVLDEAEEEPYWSAEDQIRRSYSWRVLEGFLAFTGLAEIRRTRVPGRVRTETAYRKTPMLSSILRFTV
jgi:hypothetical protein